MSVCLSVYYKYSHASDLDDREIPHTFSKLSNLDFFLLVVKFVHECASATLYCVESMSVSDCLERAKFQIKSFRNINNCSLAKWQAS